MIGVRADQVAAHVGAVAGALVVVGEALGRRADRALAGRDLDQLEAGRAHGSGASGSGRRGRRARSRAAARAGSSGASSRCAAARGGRPARGGSPSPIPRCSITLERRAAHLVEVVARGARAEERQLAAAGPRRLERVVDVGEVLAQQRPAAEPVHEPQVLERGDVARGPRRAGSSASSGRARGPRRRPRRRARACARAPRPAPRRPRLRSRDGSAVADCDRAAHRSDCPMPELLRQIEESGDTRTGLSAAGSAGSSASLRSSTQTTCSRWQLRELGPARDRRRGAAAGELRRERQEQLVDEALLQQRAEQRRATLAQQRSDAVVASAAAAARSSSVSSPGSSRTSSTCAAQPAEVDADRGEDHDPRLGLGEQRDVGGNVAAARDDAGERLGAAGPPATRRSRRSALPRIRP